MSRRGYRVGSRYVTVPCDDGGRHRWANGICLGCAKGYREVTETRRHNRSGSGGQYRRKADNARIERGVLTRCSVCWYDEPGRHRCEAGWVDGFQRVRKGHLLAEHK